MQDDAAAQEAFRELTGRIARGVAIVSAVHRGHDHATPVTDFLTVSWDPPTMLVSLYSLGRMVEAVDAAGAWGLSVLSADQAPVARWLGEPGTPLVGLLDNVPHWRTAPGRPALVTGALAWFELRTTTSVEVVTHTVVVGQVVAMGGSDGAGPALVRERGRYGTTAS